MERKKVISRSNLPARSPILSTIVFALAMDYWNAPQWLWGAIGLFMLVIWIAWIMTFFIHDEIDVISKYQSNEYPIKKKYKFHERLNEVMKEAQASKVKNK